MTTFFDTLNERDLLQLQQYFGELAVVRRERERHETVLEQTELKLRHLGAIMSTLYLLRSQLEAALEAGVEVPGGALQLVAPLTDPETQLLVPMPNGSRKDKRQQPLLPAVIEEGHDGHF